MVAAGGRGPTIRFGLRAAGTIGAALAALVGIGGGQALASAGCDAVNAGGFNQTVVGKGGGATVADFAIGDTVTFVINNGGGVWDLITGNGTRLAAFDTKRTSLGLAINVRFRGQSRRHKFMRHVRL
ncbi:MAG: hypothetical protein WB756_19645 [Xanthobacteraceae bacterium]